MHIHRTAETAIIKLIGNFPVIAVTDPRQCGKSTLVQHLMKQYPESRPMKEGIDVVSLRKTEKEDGFRAISNNSYGKREYTLLNCKQTHSKSP